MKCPYCNAEIDETEERKIYGTAEATGNESIEGFLDGGIDWQFGDSWDEYIICPHCQKHVSVWGEKIEDEEWKLDNINTFCRRWKAKYADIGMKESDLTEQKFFEWIDDHIDHIN